MQIGASHRPFAPALRRGTDNPAAAPKELSVFVYLDGEGDGLSQAASEALLNLEQAGCDGSMNVVAQLGRKQPGIDGNWTGIRRFEVAHSAHEELRVPSSQWASLAEALPQNPLASHSLARSLAQEGRAAEAQRWMEKALQQGYRSFLEHPSDQLSRAWSGEFLDAREGMISQPEWKFASPVAGEVQGTMQSPAALEDFLAWGMKTYPARRNVVVVMGHGAGPFGVQGINPTDLGLAVQRAVQRSGGSKPEMLALLACQTSALETFYSLKDAADVVVAPQAQLLSGALNRLGPYLAEARNTLEHAALGPEQLATGLVQALSQGPGASGGLTAVRSSELASVLQAVDESAAGPQPGAGLIDVQWLGDTKVQEATRRAVFAHQGPGSGLLLWSPSKGEADNSLDLYRYSTEAFARDSKWDDKVALLARSTDA